MGNIAKLTTMMLVTAGLALPAGVTAEDPEDPIPSPVACLRDWGYGRLATPYTTWLAGNLPVTVEHDFDNDQVTVTLYYPVGLETGIAWSVIGCLTNKNPESCFHLIMHDFLAFIDCVGRL